MASRTRALEELEGTAHEVLTYSPGRGDYGRDSAAKLGLDPGEVAKTLVIAGPDGSLAVCCVPVSRQLSLKRAAKALGWKRAEMAEPARAQRATGYIVGGISPLGTRARMHTLIDAPLAALDTLTVSAGQRGLSVRLAPGALAELTGAQFADISSA